MNLERYLEDRLDESGCAQVLRDYENWNANGFVPDAALLRVVVEDYLRVHMPDTAADVLWMDQAAKLCAMRLAGLYMISAGL